MRPQSLKPYPWKRSFSWTKSHPQSFKSQSSKVTLCHPSTWAKIAPWVQTKCLGLTLSLDIGAQRSPCGSPHSQKSHPWGSDPRDSSFPPSLSSWTLGLDVRLFPDPSSILQVPTPNITPQTQAKPHPWMFGYCRSWVPLCLPSIPKTIPKFPTTNSLPSHEVPSPRSRISELGGHLMCPPSFSEVTLLTQSNVNLERPTLERGHSS